MRARARGGTSRGGSGNPRRSRGACRPFNDSFVSPRNFTSRLIDYFILFYFQRLPRSAFPCPHGPGLTRSLPSLPKDSYGFETRRYPCFIGVSRFLRAIPQDLRGSTGARAARVTGNVLAPRERDREIRASERADPREIGEGRRPIFTVFSSFLSAR